MKTGTLLVIILAGLVGGLLGSAIMFGALKATDDKVPIVQVIEGTPTPCENFYRATAVFTGLTNESKNVLLMMNIWEGEHAEKARGQLVGLFDKCLDYAR